MHVGVTEIYPKRTIIEVEVSGFDSLVEAPRIPAYSPQIPGILKGTHTHSLAVRVGVASGSLGTLRHVATSLLLAIKNGEEEGSC